MEDVEHHVKEEEATMFPLVKEKFSAAMLDELGSQMEKAKKDFQKSSAASAGK
jgi:hemerythrin-like domain-containing protein